MDHQDPADNFQIQSPDNYTFDGDITPEDSRPYIAHEIVFILFCIVGICADIAIIYTMFRFRRMRTVPNIFLANWAIADICSLIVTPSGYRIISVFDHISYTVEFFCILVEAGTIFHITVTVFVLLVTIDWFIAAYFRRASEKFRSFYKYILGTIWIAALLCSSIATGLCINSIYVYFTDLSLICTYGSILLSVIALQCSRAIQKCRKRPLEYPSQMLNLASAFALSYILAFLNILILHLTAFHPLIAILSACAIFSSSIVNFTLLYFFNKDFQACFLQAIRCTKGRYEESITDFDNPTNNVGDNAYSVQVSFHNPTEELLTNAY